MCKSPPRSRQITMPAPHWSVFDIPDALPVESGGGVPGEAAASPFPAEALPAGSRAEPRLPKRFLAFYRRQMAFPGITLVQKECFISLDVLFYIAKKFSSKHFGGGGVEPVAPPLYTALFKQTTKCKENKKSEERGVDPLTSVCTLPAAQLTASKH